MATIKTVSNQTIIGLAVQQYGNVAAITELIKLNDFTGKLEQPAFLDGEADLAYSLKKGTEVTYDENSPLRNTKVLRIISGMYITDGFKRKGVYSKQYTNQYA